MPFDLYPEARRAMNEDIATQPAYGPPQDDFLAALLASGQAAAGSLAELRAIHNAQQPVYDWLDAFQGQTGYRPEAFSGQLPGTFDYAALNKAYTTEKTARPGFDLTPPPTPEQAWQIAMDKERQIAAEDARIQSRPQSPLSQLGSFLGSVGAFAVDPITILSTAALSPEAGGIVLTALRDAAVFGAQQAAISTSRLPVSQALNPNYGVGDILGEAAQTGISGAGLGLVGRLGILGIASAWARVKTGAWPQYVRDAGNVVTRQAVNTIGDPNVGRGAGAAGDVSFAQNARAAEAAVATGKPVEPTPDLFTQGTYRPGTVFTSDGKPVGVQYQVVEGASLVTSNRPDLSVNPDYPQELQPRDRTRAASADQINAIAANLEPTRLGVSSEAGTGAPIVGPDNVTESGNARVLAILRAYQDAGDRAAEYRSFLAKEGFDVTGMQNPVMIARRITTMSGEERASFANAANQAVAMRMSAPELAASDARFLDEGVLGKLASDKGLDTAENRPFVRAFFSKLPATERGSLIDRAGTLSQEGQRRVQAALLARAYGDAPLLSRLLESPDSGMKGIGGALTDAAGPWAAMRAAVSRGTVQAQMDLTPDLIDAFRLVQTARARGVKAGDLLAQGDAFNPVSPATKALLGMMFKDAEMTKAASRPSIARALRGYAEEAVKNTTDARLFEDAIGAGDVLQASLAKVGREDLAAPAEVALQPEAVAKAKVDPVTDDASIHAADHLLETTPDMMIADPLGTLNVDGKPVMRPVRALLDEADAEIAAAKEIEACASGTMLEAAE